MTDNGTKPTIKKDSKPLKPAEPQPQFIPDEDTLSVMMVQQWEGRFAYFYGQWHEYCNGYWVKRESQEMKREVRAFLRTMRGRGISKVTKNLIGTIFELADMDCYVPDRVVNNAPGYVNLRDGLFNLETFEMEEHRQDLYLTWQLDYEYDEAGDCPHFMRYIKSSLLNEKGETDWQLLKLFQEALGYSMTEDTSMKASFWIVGPKDSGKSTLMAFLKRMMGDMHGTVDLNEIRTNRYLIATLAGKRVITCTEADANGVLPDAIFKAIVGGSDEIQADVKYRDPITFVPVCKVWWAMNDTPRILDKSGAVHRRIFAIPFNRSIPISERDPHLLEKLMAERGAIFWWAMGGLRRLYNAGDFTRADQSEQFREKYQRRSDIELMFLEECGYRLPESKTPAGKMQTAYAYWRKINGYGTKSAANARADFERLGLRYLDERAGRFYFGFQLNDDGEMYASKS